MDLWIYRSIYTPLPPLCVEVEPENSSWSKELWSVMATERLP